MANMQGQDWNPVILSKRPQGAKATQTPAALQAALRAGQVEAVKKHGGANKAHGAAGATKDAAKLDRETEELSHERVSSELKKRIMAARLAKKMTQAQLAQAINEKPQVIQEYESGKAIPSPAVLSKLSRVLGVVLSNKGPKK